MISIIQCECNKYGKSFQTSHLKISRLLSSNRGPQLLVPATLPQVKRFVTFSCRPLISTSNMKELQKMYANHNFAISQYSTESSSLINKLSGFLIKLKIYNQFNGFTFIIFFPEILTLFLSKVKFRIINICKDYKLIFVQLFIHTNHQIIGILPLFSHK